MDRAELREKIKSVLTTVPWRKSGVYSTVPDREAEADQILTTLIDPLVGETRSLALGEAGLMAAQVATLAERMQSPFREGVELACEEIITRLMNAGALRIVDPTAFALAWESLGAQGRLPT